VLADLHCHYPMHLVPFDEDRAWTRLKSRALSLVWRDVHRASLVTFVRLFFSDETPFSGARVNMDKLRRGDVGLMLSVLYQPGDEFTLASLLGRPPRSVYREDLERQLAYVTDHITRHHADVAVVVKSKSDLEAARAAGKTAVVHCVEGGFQLGADEAEVGAAVARLAAAGVAYITLAHLFFRRVATNANAFPLLTDKLFRRLLPQHGHGLCPLGEAALTAMVEHRVLVDVSHMDEASLRTTFAQLDRLDPGRTVPVLASHSAYRFGDQDYNLEPWAIEQIAARNGVIGLILADHQLCDGGRPQPRSAAETAKLLADHARAIERGTGSLDHGAIGSDLDGFIKPVVAGFQDAAALKNLEGALATELGDAAAAEAIARRNAERLIDWVFAGRP
jgi:microsomal dipeptidase-like Zn-dependent dipeptidase